MNITRKFKTTTLVLGLAFLGFSCSDSNNSGSAAISGQVDDGNQKSVVADGTVVSAAQITSNGSVQTISGTEVDAEASGRFDIAVDAEAYQNIVVQAKSETETTMGYVGTRVENGSSYTIKPINFESTAETKVYSELVASGNADMVNKAEIEAVVTSTSAAAVNSSSSESARIATALSNSARVRAEYFESEFGSEADAKMETVVNAMVDAQTRLEAQLNTATSVEARQQAYATFRTSFTNAYLNAEMEASAAAKIIEMWGRVFVNSTSNASATIKSEANTQVSLLTATVIDAAVQVEMEAAGASQSSVDAAVQAGVTLKSEINAAAGTMSEIRAAFEAYNEEVKTAMENDSNFSATAVITVDSEINSTAGPKSTFNSSIASTVSAELVMDVYSSFFSSIESSVESNFSGSDAKLKAVTELMILINTAS